MARPSHIYMHSKVVSSVIHAQIQDTYEWLPEIFIYNPRNIEFDTWNLGSNVDLKDGKYKISYIYYKWTLTSFNHGFG